MPEADRIRPVAIALLLLLAAVSLGTLVFSGLPAARPAVTILTHGSSGSTAMNATAETSEADRIPVYLVGAVARPGIYEVIPGTYLYELVELAGGLTPQAAADRINLVYRIEDSRLLRIASVEEAGGSSVLNDDVLSEGSAGQGKVNINTAGATELETLAGIGPSTAQAIIAFRTENGPFRSIEEIMNVAGIKQTRFDAIKAAITT